MFVKVIYNKVFLITVVTVFIRAIFKLVLNSITREESYASIPFIGQNDK